MFLHTYTHTHTPCFGDLLVLELAENELCRLSRWVDDERITIESVQHNCIFRAQVVSRQTVGLPAKAVVRI